MLDACRDAARRAPACCSRATSTRARRDRRSSRELFPRGARLRRHLRARRAAARVLGARPQRPRLRRRAAPARRRHARAVAHCPSSQRLPGLRHLPDGAPRRARRALRDGHRRRRRHRPEMLKEGLVAYHVQMVRDQGHMLGPAHLLYLATAAGAQALGLERHLRRPHARQAGRPRPAQAAAPTPRSRPCSRRRRTGTPRSARSSRSPARSASSRPACAGEIGLTPGRSSRGARLPRSRAGSTSRTARGLQPHDRRSSAAE